jgi:hypothetical protein
MSWLADNWPMVAGFAAVLVAWGKTTTDVMNNKAAILEMRAGIAATNNVTRIDIAAVKDAVARIETHIEYTRNALTDIKNEARGRTAALDDIKKELLK